ncbi:MAG: acylneuraminate cytidylyltransferase family protein [Acetobacterium sp.]|uniref:acylneuraminate cytidylyltransferase family protein n=1 Tax=Acetobacterium sp. TaxID=1872094 RepID=UPI003242B4AE
MKNNGILAVIPARSGSKGLKDKNIKKLNGKPLLAYTIEAAIESSVFKEIIVSTDSETYADIARQFGAHVPFLRSAVLAEDSASTNDVITEVLDWINREKFSQFMLLQPTSPLRTANDITNALNLFTEKKANAVVSLCEVDHSPMYTGLVPENLRIDSFLSKDISYRRQDLPKYFRLNGAIYLSDIDYFLKYKNLYEEKCFAYIMDKRRSVDIDDEFDFELATFLLKSRKDKSDNI